MCFLLLILPSFSFSLLYLHVLYIFMSFRSPPLTPPQRALGSVSWGGWGEGGRGGKTNNLCQQPSLAVDLQLSSLLERPHPQRVLLTLHRCKWLPGARQEPPTALPKPPTERPNSPPQLQICTFPAFCGDCALNRPYCARACCTDANQHWQMAPKGLPRASQSHPQTP